MRVYELTDWGAELEPVLIALGRWGSRSALPDAPAQLSPDAFAIALATMFEPGIAGDLERAYHLRFGEHGFSVRVATGAFEVTRADAPAPDAALGIETEPATLTALLWHGGSVDDAIAAGALTLEGSKRELARFLRLFAAPVPAAAA